MSEGFSGLRHERALGSADAAELSKRSAMVVFVPAHPAPDGSGNIVFEVRQRPDGSWALPVFSSARQLAVQLGNAQPWVAVPLEKAMQLMGEVGVDQVVLNPIAEPLTTRWRVEDLQDLTRRTR